MADADDTHAPWRPERLRVGQRRRRELWSVWDRIAADASLDDDARITQLVELALGAVAPKASQNAGPSSPAAAQPSRRTASPCAESREVVDSSDHEASSSAPKRRRLEHPAAAAASAEPARASVVSEGFPPFPADVLFHVFGMLDAHSLLLVSRVCRQWRALVVGFEKTFWRGMCSRTWNTARNAVLGSSWKDVYMMHHNLHFSGSAPAAGRDRYLFASFKDTFEIPADLASRHESLGERSGQPLGTLPHPAPHSAHAPRALDHSHATPSLDSSFSATPAFGLPASGSFDAQSLETDASARALSGHRRPSPPTARNVFAWPASPSQTYTVAVDGNVVCWINTATHSLDLRVGVLDESLPAPFAVAGAASQPNPPQAQTLGSQSLQSTPEAGTVNTPDTIVPKHYLRGHKHPVSLVLANHQGNFVSFDESSTIIAWDIASLSEYCRINPTAQLGHIFSMNVHKRRIVGGGSHGRIVVWNMDTLAVDAVFSIPERYVGALSATNLLNVAIWDDIVVCGLFDGTFIAHSISSRQLLYQFSSSDIVRPALPALDVGRFRAVAAADAAAAAAAQGIPELVMASLTAHSPTSPGPAAAGNDAHGFAGAGLAPEDLVRHDSESGPPSGTQSPLLQPETTQLPSHHQPQHPAPFSVLSLPSTPLQVPAPETPAAPQPQDPLVPPLLPPPPLPQQQQQLLPPQMLDMQGPTSHAPMTLAVNGHVLITNGPARDEIAVWHLSTGRPICLLSESAALARDRLSIPDYRDIKFAEISSDGSCIFSSVMFEGSFALLVWDFRARRRCTRRFTKVCLDDSAQIEIWVCTDDTTV
ncbi:hypothetical protein HK105_202874 [Polyrhizophydium stewartii]|uniref:F-box domain-containing protein n=1 Tax=Polyrhizophydium stewartii TaxID=2732419 RepID=A0ABR4NDI3_9FUNG